MRPATATAAAVSTLLLGAGAAAVAAGRLASSAALGTPLRRPLPGDPRLTVHGTGPGTITLTRSLASLRPGLYGLTGPGVHAVVGPVLDGAASPDTVVRRLVRGPDHGIGTGARVRLTPQVHNGDPASALGLPFSEVLVPGELGALPAWFVPGDRTTWVIAVHGIGTTREHPLNVLGLLHRLRFPVLDLAYRGDAGAPRPPDGLSHLGDSEWRDLDAAVRHAVRHGAERVVVHGFSTGATMALRAAAGSGLRDRISGLVLDSPVFDWEGTVRALAAARGAPAPLVRLAVRAALGRTGPHRDGLAEALDPAAVRVPVLVAHGPGDALAPWGHSRRLAAERPDLVTLHTVADAPHGAMWNAAPEEYEEAVRRFLVPLM
ncbi:alpha/beta hydrolase family protein [Streptomyces sp. C10-9-1]|uniref:alpha/beta hydrolase family protein n=1 Tax=Streptomyces sp. C10-9-1 TaxID=1859285 RepID=UPI003D733708